MGNIRVLLASEPKAYREAMAAALRQIRPDVDVTVLKPEELDAALERLDQPNSSTGSTRTLHSPKWL